MTEPTSRRYSTRAATVAGTAAVLALVVAGCTAPASGTDAEAVPLASAQAVADDPATQAQYSAFYDQTLTWSSCDSGFECATATVPVDWSAPDGATTTLALKKLPASGDAIGTLFINPGGPGESGAGFTDSARSFFSSEVRQVYDVVGWDPRGVADSSGITCVDDAALDVLLASDSTPDTAAERTEATDLMTQFGEACVAEAGDLAGTVDTVSTVKDLDVLRALVGDQTLSYYGASYGTYIGAWYAQLFPWRAGRLVLDGAVDPSLDVAAYAEGQAQGFAEGLAAFVESCLADELGTSCPLRGTTDQGVAQITALLEAADATPLTTSDADRPLTQSLMVTGLAMGMYADAYWPTLADSLTAAMQGDGDGMLVLADAYNERGDDGTYSSILGSNSAIYCLDHADTYTVDEIGEIADTLGEKYPPFGEMIGWGLLGCSVWPEQAVVPAQQLTAEGAAPIVVVGTTQDPATPYAWAEALADQLQSGVLVTREGTGHTGYSASTCVQEAADTYLIAGTAPADGTVCT